MDNTRAQELAQQIADNLKYPSCQIDMSDDDFVEHATPIIQTALETYAKEQAALCGEWQPIETAPKDLDGVLVGYWDKEHFATDTWVSFAAAYQRVDFDEEEGQLPTLGWMPLGNGGDGKEYQIFPTHWMPLPKPPLARAEKLTGGEK